MVNNRTNTRGPPLIAANGSSIRTFGKTKVLLRIDVHSYEWSFHLANVSQPILGADFLRKNALLVDLGGSRLIDNPPNQPITNKQQTNKQPTNSQQTNNTPCVNNINNYNSLLAEYPELLGSASSTPDSKHGVEHFIITKGPPIHSHARRLAPEKLAIAKAEFEKMENLGIIRRSNSPWASPLHVVPKADGGWRPCGDYRRLNESTTPDCYPVPNIQDFSARLAEIQIFSKVDLIRGYYQIPMTEVDVPKTAIITPFGLFEFLRMPFGLKNAAQTFQRLMDTVCRGLDFVFVYLDDILVASTNQQQHSQNLRELFERLKQHG